jgi:hypothetical protein
VVPIVVVGSIVDHYWLRFEKPDIVIVNNITSHNNMNNSSVKPHTVMFNNKIATTI